MYQVFAVSDGTGTTAERVVRAALTQFKGEVNITRYGDVRSVKRIRQIVAEAVESNGFIVHTLVSAEMRRRIFVEGRRRGVATIDLMGPLLARLTDLLAAVPLSKPGLFQPPFDDAYLRRVEALRFAVRHDDARNTHELAQANIVLVGVSRTCKTPLSIYLANQGWYVANVPLIFGLKPPANLFALPKRRVVALMVDPERLSALRGVRAKKMGTGSLNYANLDFVRREVTYAYELIGRRPDWPIVDMTSKPIEEAAQEIVSLVGLRADGSLLL
jgi:regulator of PEP synthase PpsR (kinase-PPPase family)